MFSKYKAFLNRNYKTFKTDWFRVHSLAIMSITPQMGLNYFKKTTLIDLVDRHPLSEEYKARMEEYTKIILITDDEF